ncbi:hypothetical protein [Streptomyces sp. NPDC001781]
MDQSFSEFLKTTRPAPDPQRACPTCGTWSLRTYTDPEDNVEKVGCTNLRCDASPFRAGS